VSTSAIPEWFEPGIRHEIQEKLGEVRQTNLSAAPHHLQEAFRTPVSHANETTWEGLVSPTNICEVQEALATCGLHKAAGPSGRSTRLIREVISKNGKEIVSLFTLCLRKKHIPAGWKAGLLFMIPKTGVGCVDQAPQRAPGPSLSLTPPPNSL
jgi:hypothetical protein